MSCAFIRALIIRGKVCEVAFAEWTEDEQLRQTTFLGWRDDKSAKEVAL